MQSPLALCIPPAWPHPTSQPVRHLPRTAAAGSDGRSPAQHVRLPPPHGRAAAGLPPLATSRRQSCPCLPSPPAQRGPPPSTADAARRGLASLHRWRRPPWPCLNPPAVALPSFAVGAVRPTSIRRRRHPSCPCLPLSSAQRGPLPLVPRSPTSLAASKPTPLESRRWRRNERRER